MRLESNDAYDPRGAVWAKLVLTSDAKCAAAFGSFDGKDWKPIGAKTCFSRPLAFQGLSASSADRNRRVKYLVAGPGPVCSSDRVSPVV